MEALSNKIALFPGCSLEGSSRNFDLSLRRVFAALGCALTELKDWNCCGATSAHAIDRRLYLSLNLRNLALAEAQGFEEILAPCAACYHRLAGANLELTQSPALLGELNRETGLNYRGRVKVRNALDFLTAILNSGKLAARVTHPLSGMKVACYYGCLNTRLPRAGCFDDRENPVSMDAIVRALGGRALDWSCKTECCGASMFISAESVSAKLVGNILKDAAARGAECIAGACPLCQNNLDTKQREIREALGLARPLPVLFITQLMGLAFGMSEKELGLGMNFTPLRERLGVEG
jgi:heterodisulfide reductase subunit B